MTMGDRVAVTRGGVLHEARVGRRAGTLRLSVSGSARRNSLRPRRSHAHLHFFDLETGEAINPRA
jgi:hypothetical protein